MSRELYPILPSMRRLPSDVADARAWAKAGPAPAGPPRVVAPAPCVALPAPGGPTADDGFRLFHQIRAELVEEFMSSLVLRYKLLHPAASPPRKASEGAAAWDLACVSQFVLPADETVRVNTGLAMTPPRGYFIKLEGRSGLARDGISVEGGVIDPDYTGEIKVVLRNTGKDAIFEIGQRIAQFVLLPLVPAEAVAVAELEETARGPAGFGSTGR